MTDVSTSSVAAVVVGVLGHGLVDPDEPVVRADDLGLSRGDGCFETARLATGADGHWHVDNLDSHLARLTHSAAALQIDVDVAACRQLMLDVARAWGRPGEAAVKLMVTRGVEGSGRPTVVASVRATSAESLRQRREGVRAITLARGTAADAHSAAGWLLGGVKSLSYALNMAAQREAVRLGAEDAIWISSDGFVLESPTAAVLWSVGGRLYTTPPGATGVLASTTVIGLFAAAADDGWQSAAALLPVSEVREVDGIWLVSSVRGVTQVVQLDGHQLAHDQQLTDRLNAYAGI